MFAAHNALIPAVYIMLVRPGQAGAEILLQLRQGTGFMDEHWACGVAGHLEYGEQPAQGALRECLEEIGLQLEPQDLQPFQAVHFSCAAIGRASRAWLSPIRPPHWLGSR